MPIILETKDVIKQYKQSEHTVTAVNRVSLKVEDGEFIAIIGSSGSGKSTFLNICAGLDRADSGSVKIRGNELTKMVSFSKNITSSHSLRLLKILCFRP